MMINSPVDFRGIFMLCSEKLSLILRYLGQGWDTTFWILFCRFQSEQIWLCQPFDRDCSKPLPLVNDGHQCQGCSSKPEFSDTESRWPRWPRWPMFWSKTHLLQTDWNLGYGFGMLWSSLMGCTLGKITSENDAPNISGFGSAEYVWGWPWMANNCWYPKTYNIHSRSYPM